MDKLKLVIIGVVVAIFLFFIWAIFNIKNASDTTKIGIGQKSIELYFYDNKTNCSLDGNIYSGGTFIGNSKDGKFILFEEDYLNKFEQNSIFYIIGRTGYCFGEDNNLPFYRGWTFVDWDYLFTYEENETFTLELTPRQPRYYEEMQGFIRPDEVKEKLSSINTNPNKTLYENIKKIFWDFHMAYISDFHRFGKREYWQTPAETIKNKNGDCEDWTVTVLSLLRAYDPSLNCYMALWDTHTNIICQINRTFIIYDQDHITKTVVLDPNPNNEYIITQENKIALRSMRNSYFDDYGISADERMLSALFNEKELIIFEERNDFIDWALDRAEV